MQNWTSREDCLNALIFKKNVVCMMARTTAKICELNSERVYKKRVMKLVQDCPWLFITRMTLSKSSRYLKAINNVLMYYPSTGIPTWSMLRSIEREHADTLLNMSELDDKSSKPQNLQIWFIVKFFACGLGLAALVLYFEILTAGPQ